jgi:transportin-1
MACAQGFAEYAPPVFQRAVRIVHDQLVRYSEWQAAPEDVDEEPDKTFLIVALDLLSGLTQGLGPLIEQLIAASNPPLLPLIGASLKVCTFLLTCLRCRPGFC